MRIGLGLRVGRPRGRTNADRVMVTETFATQNTTDWNGWDANTVVSGGTLTITANGLYSAIQSFGRYDLANAYTAVQLVTSGNTARVEASGVLQAVKTLGTDELNFYCGGGFLTAAYRASGAAEVSVLSAAYVPATHKWMRIRAAAAVIYWETSADGTTWTAFASAPAPFAVNAVTIRLMAGDWNSPVTPTTWVYDNLITPVASP